MTWYPSSPLVAPARPEAERNLRSLKRQKMATDPTSRRTIIGRVGLLGASAGIVLGLIEAACLRLTDLPLPLQKPHVPPSFWFFAPLLTSVVFGLLGLLAGFLAALPQLPLPRDGDYRRLRRFDGRLPGLVLQYSQSGRVWFIVLRECHHAQPSYLQLVFAWTLAALCGPPGSLAPLWASLAEFAACGFGRGVVFGLDGRAGRRRGNQPPSRSLGGIYRSCHGQIAIAQHRPDRVGHDARRPFFFLRVLPEHHAERRSVRPARSSF